MSETYFFDTYAIIEILRGNPKYKDYINSRIITSIFNIAELNYILKKEMVKEKGDGLANDYYKFTIETTFEDICEAMNLKTKYRNLSIPDAIGYTLANKHKVKFLTGDEDFRKFKNVEFIKK